MDNLDNNQEHQEEETNHPNPEPSIQIKVISINGKWRINTEASLIPVEVCESMLNNLQRLKGGTRGDLIFWQVVAFFMATVACILGMAQWFKG